MQTQLRAFGQKFAQEFSTRFYGAIAIERHTSIFIERLSPEEFDRLKQHQIKHLIQLADPAYSREALRSSARHIGRVHSQLGLDVLLVAQAYRLQADLVGQGSAFLFSVQTGSGSCAPVFAAMCKTWLDFLVSWLNLPFSARRAKVGNSIAGDFRHKPSPISVSISMPEWHTKYGQQSDHTAIHSDVNGLPLQNLIAQV